MLLSSQHRAHSISSRTAQPKRYFLPSTLSLPGRNPDYSSHAPLLPAAAKLAAQLLEHSTYFQERLSASLTASSIPPHVLSLPAHVRLQPSMTQPPTPIIPLLTPRARALSAHLLAHGLNARPISWPTVPKGTDLVRVCLHASNTRAELDTLVGATVAWAVEIVREEGAEFGGKRDQIRGGMSGMDPGRGVFLKSKL